MGAWADAIGPGSCGASTVGAGSEVGDVGDMSDVEVDAEGTAFVMPQGASEEDERAMSMFLPSAGGAAAGGAPLPKGQTLADVIMAKIQEKERKAEKGEAASQAGDGDLSEKITQVYLGIGKGLHIYKKGKIPKAFKIIPSLTNWEEVLSLTNPQNWSPAAMYEAVCIFASSLNPKMVQRFYNLVLLPAIRQNVQKWKRLNFHYYRSLKKSMSTPAAFFKGIVLPLAADNCSLPEAIILCSVLGTSCPIPAMHSCCCIVRLCTMRPWYGTTSILLATMLSQKYALPVQVVSQVVAHFAAFQADDRVLPVVWHRSLLVFVQRYRFQLTDVQRKQLKDLNKVHFHEGVGSEIHRELVAAKSGVPPGRDGADRTGDS